MHMPSDFQFKEHPCQFKTAVCGVGMDIDCQKLNLPITIITDYQKILEEQPQALHICDRVFENTSLS